MNIETANRLLEYRKKAGYSQEELAEKIGVSRQAVSKWERSEASPDTDNLITLAKLYGVSMDELLGLKATAHTGEDLPPEKDEVHISFKDGIRVDSKDGDKVRVSFKEGVHIVSKGEDKVHFVGNEGVYYDDNGEEHQFTATKSILTYIPVPTLTLALFLGWGFSQYWGGWRNAWLIFFLVPVYYSIVDAIKKRDASHFAFPVLVAWAYLSIGMFTGIWHPTWIIFVLIPIYYFVAELIKKLFSEK